MVLEFAALPLAFLAGVISILSPCIWPLVPLVMGSAASGGRGGPIALAFGLSLSFALAGSLLSFVLVNTGTDPEFFRYIAAGLMLLVGLMLVIKPLGNWVTLQLSKMTSHFNLNAEASTLWGQFGVGMLLGLVWLPCVGPTLGAAIALASMGQQMTMAFTVMFVFGAGTASVLVIAALLLKRLATASNARVIANAEVGKKILGWMILLLGAMVLTGFDKVLQTWALQILPDWVTGL